ncbi:protein ITPRID2 [Mugil cephalus]|uniref:protein ITPRID2 n=1 Tax=Mugil cephalus TaxID=48193 RepID=UPI001FB6E3EC|nr:protein ITPRID2 [Mugil cephalus]XP_047437970.1 protein ITPRID2 [Mugil cephalus]XP_047437971.1 protein ITPRID2 [Mugil cephalus]
MESPSSTVRRRAWINSSRQWPTLEEPEGPLCSLPSASIADDDVFSDGCFTGKIENWLLGCGSNPCSENSGQLSFESVLQAGNLTDDLSLGADASVLSEGEVTCEVGLPPRPPFRRQNSQPTSSTPRRGLCLPSLNLGHSMASSCLSSSTWKTTSSVSEVLQLCSEDAEETLYELGFGCEEPQVTVRIPPRFFTFPSQAQGINFRLFLDSQLRRIREEDPSLSLASRFRQVQVLTAMANAFYSLYSHVSRTPLQKLATPEFTFSSSPAQRIERFRSSVRSEPRSPVERLKDTVNKMCLYTGSPRGSDSTSPQPSPRKRSSLPDVVDVILKAKGGASKKLELELCDRSNSASDLRLLIIGNRRDEQTRQVTVDPETLQGGNETCHKEMQDNEQTNNADSDENCVKRTDLDRMTHDARTSLTSSLSGETVIETGHPLLSCQPEVDSCFTQSDTKIVEQKPVAKVTYDLICPQIVECVHKVPFCCKNTHSPNTSPHISSKGESTDRACPRPQGPISETNKDSHGDDLASSGDATHVDASRLLPVLEPSGGYAHYSITVTGWDGDDASSCPLNTSASSHASPVPPAHTRHEESFNVGKRQYLNPLTHQGPGHSPGNLQQVNSFELEEVHSAGEEDFGQSEATTRATSPLSKKLQYKGEVVRGDSMQSDSSGYAEEELSPSLDRYSR